MPAKSVKCSAEQETTPRSLVLANESTPSCLHSPGILTKRTSSLVSPTFPPITGTSTSWGCTNGGRQ